MKSRVEQTGPAGKACPPSHFDCSADGGVTTTPGARGLRVPEVRGSGSHWQASFQRNCLFAVLASEFFGPRAFAEARLYMSKTSESSPRLARRL